MTTRTTIAAFALALGLAGLARAEPPPPPTASKCPHDCQMECAHGGRGAMRGGGGWTNGPYAQLYDPKTVATLKGEIVQVDLVAPMRGMSDGVHVVLKGDQGTTDVHLGPAWYLDHQDTQLAVGDRVEVRGSKVTVGGKPAVVAAEVRKGNATLQLRDAQGLPMWRGWR
ncbi:MAG TPA: DNA-binding protein [Polyangia bacterium]